MITDEVEKTLIYDLWRLWDIGERLGYTAQVADYYERLSKESKEPKANTYYNIAESMRNCHKLFDTLTWTRKRVKAIERVNLCRNKFCANCVKLIQATRLKRMYGAIQEAEQTKYMYHTVWTVPNVKAEALPETLSVMNNAFSMLIRYFSGVKNIRGLDLSRYKFYAAVKSIECTYKDSGMYHPHFHAIFAFDEPFPVEGDIVNEFSESRANGRRTFSEEVVTMQKLWKLLNDFRKARNEKIRDLNAKGIRYVPFEDVSEFTVVGENVVRDNRKKKYVHLINNETVKSERVTKEKIEALPLGYSVIFDNIDGRSCYEVFKYAFKCMSEDASIMSYEQFKTLRSAFYHKQTIQTYGAWHNIAVNDEIDEEISDAYKRYVAELNLEESPERRRENLFKIIKAGEEYDYKIITASNLSEYLPARADIEQAWLKPNFFEDNLPPKYRKYIKLNKFPKSK